MLNLLITRDTIRGTFSEYIQKAFLRGVHKCRRRREISPRRVYFSRQGFLVSFSIKLGKNARLQFFGVIPWNS